MAPPRPGRSRRVVDSEDEAEQPSHTSKPSTVSVRSRQTILLDDSSPAKASTKPTTPKKSKATKSAKIKSPENAKGTIFSFFNAATQAQSSQPAAAPPPVPSKANEDVDDIDDIDDGPSHIRPGTAIHKLDPQSNTSSFASRKRSSDDMGKSSGGATQSITQGVSKFLKRYDGVRTISPSAGLKTITEQDPRPWTEKYAPQSLEELVVHKKKVSDVRQWIHGSLSGDKHKKLLVLKGAAGSGKTATVSLLSKALGFDLVEWKNPRLSNFGSGDYVSVSNQFDDFIGRGRTFGTLDFISTNDTGLEAVPRTKEPQPNGSSQVLLVEEFPNNVSSNSVASQGFRSSILQVLSASTIPATPPTPLIMIISESVLSNSSSSSDNYTAHRLLGPEILHHPSTAVIEFNAVAPTFISKALSLVLQKRSREAGRYYSPHIDVMKKLAEFGDVRNATSTLEFLCLQKGDLSSLPSKPTKKQQTQAKSTRSTDVDSDLSLVALRESSIGLFHAVGKVVHSKRAPREVTDEDGESQLPEHLKHHARPLLSEVDVDSLIDETGTDPSTFISALHENYLLSCRPSPGKPETDLDIINGCLDTLCDADILSNVVGGRATNYTGAGEALRQSELAFQVGVRGILFTLQHPVKREALPGRPKAEAYRMFYPASLKLWRKREEMHDLIELLTTRELNDKLLTGMRLLNHSGVTREKTTKNPNNEKAGRVCLGSGDSPLQEMLLERLPYLVHLLSRDQPFANSSTVKQMQQVTRFTGVRVLQDDDEYDESAPAFDNLPRPGEVARRGLGFLPGHGDEHEGLDVQKLVLSDDDIEDD